MPSSIGSLLTDSDRLLLEQVLIQDPKKNLRRQLRLTVQYFLATSIFLFLTINQNDPYYAVPIYVTFIIWMLIRIRNMTTVAGSFKRIVECYEKEIKLHNQ